MTPHYNVVIVTPGDKIYMNYASSLVDTIQYFNDNGVTYKWLNHYSPHIADARHNLLFGESQTSMYDRVSLFHTPKSHIAQLFQGTMTYDQIVWIDNDVSWTVDQMVALLAHQEEVVTGAYRLAHPELLSVFLKNADLHPSTVLLTTHELDNLNKEKLYEVACCGMGFLKVRSGVFESMKAPIFTESVIDIPYTRNNETCHYATNHNYQEDISFCFRVQELGCKIYFDPKIILSHYKRMMLTHP